MKLISWNVNGLRAILQKGFLKYVEDENPDILCLQEIKVDEAKVQLKIDGYEHYYFNCAIKKGYSGTAIASKIKPIKIIKGIGASHHDQEGRVLTLEFQKFYLVNVYTPNSQRGLTRLKYRQEWDEDFLSYIKNLTKNKPVIFCGDLNVAHEEIDIANPKSNHKNAGFTDEERADFTTILDAGFIDTFRYKHPNKVQYSWWSYMFNARAKNIGWRIDYFLISKSLKNNLKDAFIRSDIQGSDHCPVGMIIDI